MNMYIVQCIYVGTYIERHLHVWKIRRFIILIKSGVRKKKVDFLSLQPSKTYTIITTLIEQDREREGQAKTNRDANKMGNFSLPISIEFKEFAVHL